MFDNIFSSFSTADYNWFARFPEGGGGGEARVPAPDLGLAAGANFGGEEEYDDTAVTKSDANQKSSPSRIRTEFPETWLWMDYAAE